MRTAHKREKERAGMEEQEILVLTDEDGNELEFELVTDIEFEGGKYAVLAPLDEDADEVLILQYEKQAGEDSVLVTVEDDRVFEAVAERFQKLCEAED